MSTTLSKLDVTNPSQWGLETRGVQLLIDTPPSELAGDVVLDIENNPDGSFAGIGYTMDGETIHFDRTLPSKDRFKECGLVGHNVKYDVQMLRSWGIDVSPDQIIWDTQLAEYTRDSTKTRYGLKELTKERFGASYPTFKDLVGKGKKAIPVGSLPISVLANYCGSDVYFTHKLYSAQQREFTEEQRNYLEQIELPTLRVLLEMEERGVQIDADYIRDLDTRLASTLSGVAASLRDCAKAEINLNSPKQIQRFILEQTGLKLETTAAEELQKHADIPFIKGLLRYRELAKLHSTYTTKLLLKSNNAATYRLHSWFNQCITNTGRLSSSEPNLQNIPTRTEEGDQIRKGFVAKGGYVLVDADFSQIEPRLMAHISQDPKLSEIFINGKDLYNSVAELVGCDRKIAKILWLAMAYNAGAYKIATTAGITFTQAQIFLTRMNLAYSHFFYWRSKVIAQAELEGGIRTLFGRWIPLPLQFAHLGPNYMIQGSAAEIMKLAIQATRQFNPVSTVHDELIFELPDTPETASITVPAIKQAMESVVDISVPLKVEIGIAKTWSDAKP